MNYSLGNIIDYVRGILDEVFSFFKTLLGYAKELKKDEETE